MLLRGINVSGHRKVPMKELKTLLESTRFEKVQTYIQSGNVTFESDENAEQLQKIAETSIKEHFGFVVKCLVLTADEFVHVFNQHPYYKQGLPEEKLYYTLLFDAPSPEKILLLKEVKAAGEHFQLKEKTLYFYYENGYGNAKISNPIVEQKLKVFATTRNWKTMKTLVEMTI